MDRKMRTEELYVSAIWVDPDTESITICRGANWPVVKWNGLFLDAVHAELISRPTRIHEHR